MILQKILPECIEGLLFTFHPYEGDAEGAFTAGLAHPYEGEAEGALTAGLLHPYEGEE